MSRFKLTPTSDGFTTYDSNVEGRNTHAFAAAAFRYGHGTIPVEIAEEGKEKRLMRTMFRNPANDISKNGGERGAIVKR